MSLTHAQRLKQISMEEKIVSIIKNYKSTVARDIEEDQKTATLIITKVDFCACENFIRLGGTDVKKKRFPACQFQ